MKDVANNAESPEWLRPSAALNRFQLGDTTPATGDALEPKQVRYGVRVGELRILLPGDKVSEVLDTPRIFPIPNTTSWLQGLVNLRGNVVPVFDLRELFQTVPVPGQRQMVLIIDKGENALGIAIDGLPLPAPDSPSLNEPPPLPEALENFTESVFQHEQTLWLEVDISGLVESLATEIPA